MEGGDNIVSSRIVDYLYSRSYLLYYLCVYLDTYDYCQTIEAYSQKNI